MIKECDICKQLGLEECDNCLARNSCIGCIYHDGDKNCDGEFPCHDWDEPHFEMNIESGTPTAAAILRERLIDHMQGILACTKTMLESNSDVELFHAFAEACKHLSESLHNIMKYHSGNPAEQAITNTTKTATPKAERAERK